MAGTKEIKRRIKSIKNTKKITKAMELVSASKMKRAVSATLASRLYAEYSWEVLTSIAQNGEQIEHPFFKEKEAKDLKNKILVALVTSNRGLCGSYNAQAIKKIISFMKKQNNKSFDFITIGKKGDTGMRRIGRNVIATFNNLGDKISLSQIAPISRMIVDEYTRGNYDKVVVVYTDFISALNQKPNIKQILPVEKSTLKDLIDELEELGHQSKLKENGSKVDYLFEGERDKFIGVLAEKLTQMQIYQMLLESNASEQSSRMVAMKNASEASGEMIDDLTLVFNKARQANITREISEISAGMASVS
ncbi:MAG: ATP synthase F1 subunit gamma [Candidatus Paceibacterota bacterium]|jgi:F-type H+-transporting ATPase subunit gamma